MDYKLLYSDDGKLNAVYDDQGRQLIYHPHTRQFDESHFLTKRLREIESAEGKKLNLDDIKPIKLNDELVSTLAEEILGTDQVEIIKNKELDTKLNYLVAKLALIEKKLNNTSVEFDTSRLESQISLNQKAIIEILGKLTDLAIAADDSLDMENIKDLIKVLSQNLSAVALDLGGLKSELLKATNVEDLFEKLKLAIERSQKEPTLKPNDTPVEKPKSKIEPILVSLEIFGSAKLINGVFEITNSSQVWKAGFRSLVSIEKPGEYFEYRLKGKGIIGVTAFPKAKNAWDNTQYANYHTTDTSISQFINNAIAGPKANIAINQLMRFTIDEQKFFLWQTKLDGSEEYITLFKSDNALYSGVFLFGTPAAASQVSDFKIGKSVQ